MDSRLTTRAALRVFIVVSLVIIAVFSLLPLIFTAIISVRENTGFRPHFFGSSNAGLNYYKEIFGSYYLPRLLRNTAVLTLYPAVVTAVVAFLLTMAVSHLPSRTLKTIALMLLAVPSFVPLSHLSGMFINLFSPSGGITKLLFSLGILEEKHDLLVIKKNFVPIYIAFETLRYMFFPVLAGVIALDKRDANKVSGALKIALAYILVRISMTFIGGNEMIISLYRPVTYEVSDTVTSFIYRRGLLENNFGMSAAFEIFRFIAQLVINIGVFFGLKALFAIQGNPLSEAEKPEPAPHRSYPLIPVISIIAYIILASGAIFVLASLVFPRLIVEGSVLSFEGFNKIKDIGIYFFNSFIYTIPRAIIFAAISFILAYPLTARSKSLWPPVLIALSAGSLALMNYLILNGIGLLYTVIGTILFGSFSCVGAVALAFGLRGRLSGTPALREYACAAWRGTLVLFLLGFALSWGSTMYSFSVLADRTKYPISIILRESVQFGGLGDIGPAGNYSLTSGIVLVCALPPLAAVWSVLLLQKKLPAGLLSAGFRA